MSPLPTAPMTGTWRTWAIISEMFLIHSDYWHSYLMTAGCRRCTRHRADTINLYYTNKQWKSHHGDKSTRVNLLVIWSQFADGDGHPVSIVELRVDADPLSPRAAAEQHHLADTWRNCNCHPARTFSTDAEKNPKEISEYSSLSYQKQEAREGKAFTGMCFSISEELADEYSSINTVQLKRRQRAAAKDLWRGCVHKLLFNNASSKVRLADIAFQAENKLTLTFLFIRLRV